MCALHCLVLWSPIDCLKPQLNEYACGFTFSILFLHQSPLDQQTKFLALDKCLPFRDYLQFLNIDPDPQPSFFDEEGRILGGDGDRAPIIISSTFTKEQEAEKVMGDKEEEEEPDEPKVKLFIDPEWLCILQSTNDFLSLTKIPAMLPGQGGDLTYVALVRL